MDLLQLSLSLLVLLLCVFLIITGIQVFLILKDLKKALDKFNVEDIEKPVAAAAELVTSIGDGAKALTGFGRRLKIPTFRKKRFYKKVL